MGELCVLVYESFIPLSFTEHFIEYFWRYLKYFGDICIEQSLFFFNEECKIICRVTLEIRASMYDTV